MIPEKDKSLAGVALFHDVDDAIVRAFEKHCGWRAYAPHDQIIDRQSDSRDVFFIVKGRVRVVNYSISGREISFDDLDEGSIFGELAALDGEPRSANVVALEDTIVATLSPRSFQEFLLEYPIVGLALMRRLARVIRISVDRIMDLSTLGANNRVHAEILRLAKASARNEQTAVIEPVPTHGDIASRVSTARETVARVFGDLAKKGIVERKDGVLEVKDLPRLKAMVEQFRGD